MIVNRVRVCEEKKSAPLVWQNRFEIANVNLKEAIFLTLRSSQTAFGIH